MAKTAVPREEVHNLSLYRKYRPSAFDEVRGQEHITSVLRAAVESGRIAHAYLFAGGRGTGKTSTARILAKALGTSEKDIYEMDAASNRGIDEIRELREGVAVLPFDSKYKFYILDEVHALTPQAWQALLKTLEEPPAHVIFVLATTELDRVPETIVSRCQIFHFKKPTHEILRTLVLEVAKKEGAKLSPASAELIALIGEGSYRDSLGTLQKVLTLSPDMALSDEEVATVVGAPASSSLSDFLEALASRDVAAALSKAHAAFEGGVEPKVFLLLVLTWLRAVLLLRFAPKLESDVAKQFSPQTLEQLKRFAKTSLHLNAALLNELIGALLETHRAPLPALPLELALYRVFEPDKNSTACKAPR